MEGMDIGSRVREFRTELRLTQEDLGGSWT